MSKTLLLADDSVTIQKVVGISFANEDVRIVTVDNGDDAVTRAREIQPDIVLADVVMPGLSGYDVCAALKEDPALSSVPVLLLTGTFETFDEDRAARVGADGHITKPFEAHALVELVNGRLAGAPATAERTEPAASERGTAPVAEPEPFDFLEPEQTTLPRAGSGSGQRSPAPAEEDPFGFADAPLDAPDLDAEPDGLDDLGNDATEARTTILIENPDAAAAEVAETAPPVDAVEPSASEDELTRLVLPDAEPLEQAPPSLDADPDPVLDAEPDPVLDVEPEPLLDAEPEPLSAAEPELLPEAEAAPAPETAAEPDPLDGVFDPVPADALAAPPASSAYDVDSPDEDDPFRTRVIEDVEAAEGDDVLHSVAEPIFEDELSEAAALDLPAPGDEPSAETPASETPEWAPSTSSEPSAEPQDSATPVAGAEVSPALQEQMHEALEKIAWEAFGDLSERIVREAVDRIEQVAWDVMPRLAETLIREEIRKLKGEE
jgi:CheY-like chemotaxis protein